MLTMPSRPVLRRLASVPAASVAAAAVATAAVGVVLSAPHATADVAPAYGAGSTATTYGGRALDLCTAPRLATLGAWRASAYRAVGIYTSGINRACKSQPNLGTAWVRGAARSGWHLAPIHVGRQAPCVSWTRYRISRTLATAASQGAAGAEEAVAAVRRLGMVSGTAIFADIENFSTADSGCKAAVLAYVDGWVDRLHVRGMLAGVYSNAISGIHALAVAYNDPRQSRPDAVWFARWNGLASVWGDPSFGDALWHGTQRMKQYRGDHWESWGGVSLRIDSNVASVITASVPYAQHVTARGGLNVRSGPGASYPRTSGLATGTTVDVVCQTSGSLALGSRVWDRLSTGRYVSDSGLDTRSTPGWTWPLPRCTTPFQVIASVLNTRAGPTTAAAAKGRLYGGQLAYAGCQTSGAAVGSSRVWDRLPDGTYVSDYYLRSRSRTTWSAPLPRC